MIDIQRWDIDLSNGDPFKSENGDWIEYDDHLAAVVLAAIDGVQP